ncbi:MAG: FAD-dependent oxidoreductase [Actinobacteria bacterium]|nr:FAD-dependent oxidoreductase [Actinomycetota bacterium]
MAVGLDPASSYSAYAFAEHPFARPPDLDAAEPIAYPVAIVGAGLAGMTLALDLGLRGIPVLVLDRDASIGAAGIASRGIAMSKRTLEIFTRLGIAHRVEAKAVTWNEGRIHRGLEEILHFVIQPDPDERWPAFLNLQQFYTEQYLTERAAEIPAIDLRWHSRVTAVEPSPDGVLATVETPAGAYRLRADWLVCCEGAGSGTRKALGLDPPVVMFEDYWAIVDVKADLGHVQRRFWLDSPLLDGGAQIMHGMADGVVRTDWQISQFPDPELEIAPERVNERLRAILGPDVDFELVSVSRWRFRRRVMDRFVHGRLLFAGDSAHEIPPYGARGGNGGVQDADNLGWKLAAVIEGRASPALLETYQLERHQAAEENAKQSCQSQSFIWPATPGERLFRDAVLALVKDRPWSRAFLNTGRASVAMTYVESPLSLPDAGAFGPSGAPGSPPANLPVEDAGGEPGFLLDGFRGVFTALHLLDGAANAADLVDPPAEVDGFALDHVAIVRERPDRPLPVDTLVDASGRLFAAHDAGGGATVLLRPDGHVAARARAVSARLAADLVRRSLAAAETA